jgi:uncharacterized protein YegJ (DUF2314 family)
VVLKNITTVAEYNHCKETSTRLRCWPKVRQYIKPKRATVDRRVLISQDAARDELRSFGEFQYGKVSKQFWQLQINYGNHVANYGKCAKNYGNGEVVWQNRSVLAGWRT